MTYTYIYKTSDGVRHEGKIAAKTRPDAFVALRKQKIRAIKVIAADGSKDNGAIYGVRKRIVVCLIVLAAGVGVVATSLILGKGGRIASSVEEEFISSQTRRQIIGDVAVINKGIKTGWSDVFPHEGERFLASFAIPGVPAGQRNTTEREILAALKRSGDQAVEAPIASLSIEARQIAAIVEGMKQELRAYLKDGHRTVYDYGRRLVIRQDEEIDHYRKAKSELEAAIQSGVSEKDYLSLWEAKNAHLRKMGIKLIALPD